METEFVLKLTKKELISLYTILKPMEIHLEETAFNVLIHIEKELYRVLTIDEMENIQNMFTVP
jgi:hypothetical protein